MQLSLRFIFAAVVFAASVSGGVHAQGYPSKAIRLILPFPPGAPSDMVGRTVGQKIGEQIGQAFIPDNRTGAGVIGARRRRRKMPTSRGRSRMRAVTSAPRSRRWRCHLTSWLSCSRRG